MAENYANDPLGKQAALRLADSFFEEKSPLGYVEAQGRFKDFRSRYPSHPRSDYALFRLAQVSDRQAEKPDRDQANTRLAAQSYRELLQNYPGSPYAAEARARYRAMLDLLAEHEFLVAQYYFKRGRLGGRAGPLRGALRGASRSTPGWRRPSTGPASRSAGSAGTRTPGPSSNASAGTTRRARFLRKLPKLAEPPADRHGVDGALRNAALAVT